MRESAILKHAFQLTRSALPTGHLARKPVTSAIVTPTSPLVSLQIVAYAHLTLTYYAGCEESAYEKENMLLAVVAVLTVTLQSALRDTVCAR